MPTTRPAKSAKNAATVSRQVGRALRREARSLFWRGWQLTQIEEELGVNYNTLASWSRREGWETHPAVDIIDDRIEVKVANLLDKEPLTEGDMKRIDFLTRQLERTARIRKYNETGREGDLNPKVGHRNNDQAKAKRAEKRKNFLTLVD